MRIMCFAGIIILTLTMSIGECPGYPKPSLVPGPKDWTFDVVFDQPRQINLILPGDSQPRRFWYVILSLTNTSSVSEAPFYPACDLVTDTFKVVQAGKGIQKIVFEKIKKLHEGKYPFLEWIEECNHKVLQGKDNARDIAIIWPDFDAKAKVATLFISGLSNETVVIDHPTEQDEQGAAKKVLLRKTLALHYGIGGDESLRAVANMSFKDKEWVLR